MIELSRASVTYGGAVAVPVIRDLSLAIEAPEVIALVGPSGGGKTTLLRVLAALLDLSEGRLTWPPTAGRDGCWYAPQTPTLIDFRTTLENVCAARELRNGLTAEGVAAARQLIKALGLAGVEHRRPDELSGGMKRRVALAQAIFSTSGLLLLDEPFAELDAPTRHRAEEVLAQAARNPMRTVVFATHDLDSAVALADRIVVLAGPGAWRVLGLADIEPGLRFVPEGPSRRSSATFAYAVGALQELVVRVITS